MSTKTTEPLAELQLSPRVFLRPGDRFHVKRGSGPVFRADGGPIAVGAPSGEYHLLSLFRPGGAPRRIYADAVHVATGCTHCLYLAGPRYRSRVAPGVQQRPYGIRKLRRSKPR